MIDLHTHSFLSDGALIPSELLRRAEHRGIEAIAITDHVDASNLDFVVPRLVEVCRACAPHMEIRPIPGVEINHAPPQTFPRLAEQARALGEVLSALTVTIPVRAGEEDRLFGSVTTLHIEEALKLQGVGIERRKILLDEPIKQLGTFEVPIHLGGDVRGNVTVEVVREA